MIKLAFQAAIPGALFDDATDCLHRVVKPMLVAMREQLREKGIPETVRISILVDEVPAEADWVDSEGRVHRYKCGLNPDLAAIKHMVNHCTCQGTTMTNEVRKAIATHQVVDA
jgi:hypothetical protein